MGSTPGLDDGTPELARTFYRFENDIKYCSLIDSFKFNRQMAPEIYQQVS